MLSEQPWEGVGPSSSRCRDLEVGVIGSFPASAPSCLGGRYFSHL